jgi:predicted peptidase
MGKGMFAFVRILVVGLILVGLLRLFAANPPPGAKTPPTQAPSSGPTAGPSSTPSSNGRESAEQASGGVSMTPGLSLRTVSAGGVTLPYAVLVPPGVDLSVPQPLIVFLHGRGESGTDGLRQCSQGLIPAVMAEPARWPAVIVAPQKPTFDAAWSDLEPAVLAMIREVRASAKIDADRIVLTGLSQGGHGTWYIGSRNADLFAAIAPICGFHTGANAAGLAKLPIWAFHGLRDDVIPAERSSEMIQLVEGGRIRHPGGGPAPVLTLLPEAAHNSWDHAYRASSLAEWLLSARKGQSPTAPMRDGLK